MLKPCKQYHTFHIYGSVPVTPVRKYVEYYSHRVPNDKEREVRTTVMSKFQEMNQLDKLNALADLLEQNRDLIKKFEEFKKKPNSHNKPELYKQQIILMKNSCTTITIYTIITYHM